jgi:hypothetical protein
MSILFKFRYALLYSAKDLGGVGKAAEKSITSLVQELDEAFEVTISDNLHLIDATLPANILKLTKRPKSKSFYQQTNVPFTQWVRKCFIQSQDGFASPKRCVKSFHCNGVCKFILDRFMFVASPRFYRIYIFSLPFILIAHLFGRLPFTKHWGSWHTNRRHSLGRR